MSRLFKISGLILLYFLTCGKSCDNQEQFDATTEQQRVKTGTDSLHTAFGSDTLSPTALQAFSVTAKVKFSDLFDYMRILNDSNAAEPFRDKAEVMIHSLFQSENSVFQLMNPDNSVCEEVPVKQLFSGKTSLAGFGPVVSDSIRIVVAPDRLGNGTYIGKLSYRNIRQGTKSTGKADPARCSVNLEFLITKHDKIFGPDTLSIWEVFLGRKE
jgi:hypothetical protein